MLKKTITYTDYNGVERKEDFYFNLSKAELMEMEMSTTGGMDDLLKRIMKESDNKKLVELFKGIILKALGEKSPDGKRFIKNDQIRENFEQSEAYTELFMELIGDADAAANFIKGVVPANLAKEVNEEEMKKIAASNI